MPPRFARLPWPPPATRSPPSPSRSRSSPAPALRPQNARTLPLEERSRPRSRRRDAPTAAALACYRLRGGRPGWAPPQDDAAAAAGRTSCSWLPRLGQCELVTRSRVASVQTATALVSLLPPRPPQPLTRAGHPPPSHPLTHTSHSSSLPPAGCQRPSPDLPTVATGAHMSRARPSLSLPSLKRRGLSLSLISPPHQSRMIQSLPAPACLLLLPATAAISSAACFLGRAPMLRGRG